MKLVKTSENVNKKYVGDKTTEEVTSVNYDLQDDDKKSYGTVSVTPFNYNININDNKGSIEKNLEAMKTLLGIE